MGKFEASNERGRNMKRPSRLRYRRSLSVPRPLFPNVYRLLKILANLRVTTAEAERSSALPRRLKRYLRASTSNEQLLAPWSGQWAIEEEEERGKTTASVGRQSGQDLADQKDSGAEVKPSRVQTRGSPQTSTKSSCRRPTAISDRGGGHNLSTVTTSALQEDAGPGTLKPKHLSRGYYAYDTPSTQDFHAAGRIATNRGNLL
ncbi:hypothetical protein HPB47_002592 [Ixodes persulcatus]|uniref:Uncharacterized protein n=1 Tax=Ixodes persulcatus TaxID=34615 RepID=A0AC60PKV2_IXOPE|nr:hypothetical protein HPB47_002592 [Ixodes persulcatus]